MRLFTMTLSMLMAPQVALAQAADVQLLFPPAGAEGVATNTSLLFQAYDAELRSYGGQLRDAVVLRNSAGESLSTGEIGGADSGEGFFLSTEPLALAPDATYRVLTRISPCPEEGPSAICPGEERLLGEFVTGATADMTPPEIISATGAELSFCRGTVTLEARDDRSPPSAIRYLVSPGAGEATPLGSTDGRLEFVTSPVTAEEGAVPVEVVPVDASGNRGEAIELPVTACTDQDASPWAGESDIPRLENDVLEPEAGGCSLSSPIPRGTTSAGASALVLALGAWRRRPGERGRLRQRGLTARQASGMCGG